MKKKTLLLFLVLSSFLTFGQEEDYLEYFKLPRESVFLHTNKTTYLIGEEIWFKAYTYDRKNELSSKATTNIYLGIYNKFGVQLDKKLYLAKEGLAIGHFAIDSTLASGDYFLKASTNWMKNFKEDDSFLQKIKIINFKNNKASKQKVSKKEYDFQILPEGGHLLKDVKNTIGIKAISDTGFGTNAYGTILDSKGTTITSFKTNSLGIGRFYLNPKEGETYIAKVTLENGKEFEQKLPTTENTGISIQVNNTSPNKTFIRLNTNSTSFPLLKNDSLKLRIHNGGNIKTIPVSFKDVSLTVAVQKKELFPGVNIITLFNKNNKPILERMFFNERGIKNINLEVSNIETVKDSMLFTLKNIASLSKNDTIFASISVLPSGTKSYNPSHNIISALLLKYAVKGNIENPKYYFTKINRKKLFELDALLITQGWSRYSWDNIFNAPSKPNFDFENGLTLNGFFNSPLNKANSLFLYPTTENRSSFVSYDQDGKFHLKNFYPFIGEEIKFSYMDDKGAMKKPGMSLNFIKHVDDNSINLADVQHFENISFYADKNDILESLKVTNEYRKLDEIKLKAKLKPREVDPLLINAKVTIIGKDEIESFPLVTDFIQHSGYDVFIGNLGEVSINNRRRSRTFVDVAGTANGTVKDFSAEVNNLPIPTLFIDNVRTTDFAFLSALPTEAIEKIVIDRTGLGMGMSTGFGGVIKVFTRKRVFKRSESKTYPNTMAYVAEYGFEPIKKFYVPKYTVQSTESYKKYGVIHWEPNFTITQDNSFLVKMKKTKTEKLILYIEGICSDGSVFSKQMILYNEQN